MQQSQVSHTHYMPWLTLTVGFMIGQTSQSSKKMDALYNFYVVVESYLVPLYTSLVLSYLSLLVFRTYILPQTSFRKPSSVAPAPSKSESAIALDEGVDEPQPINMSGKYKLVSISNFDSFLEAQGVPWALRRAACRARPVHNIIHKGNRLTIRIEGIIVTQTTYIINGPPVEISIRGRIFQDKIMYLENGKGIRGIKKAITENYDVIIDRVLSEDNRKITLTGRAVFKDGRDPVESVQIFERIE